MIDTIIIDEAHHAAAPTYKKIINYFSGAKLLIGLTATPKRGDNVRLDDVFDDIIFSRDLRWGIENKYLSRVRCMQVVANYSLKDVKKQAGDFKQSELDATITAEVISRAAKAYMDVCVKEHRHTLIYCLNISKCMMLEKVLKSMLPPEKKDSIQVVTGKTDPEERKQILENFASGKIDAIINCMVLTEGTDLPICDTIMNIRPTCNQTLYQQMVGRGTRLYDGKEYCLVLDIVPEDENGGRGLCTAPTLFGIDPSFLDKKQRERFTEDADLLELCNEIAGKSLEITKALEIKLKEVDAFVAERENVIRKVASAPSASFKDLANGYRNLVTRAKAADEEEYDFGDLQYEVQPSEDKRYLIHADWNDTITISKPDIMGYATIDFSINGCHFVGDMHMDKAIQLAQDYCLTVPRYMWYSWSRTMQKTWADMEPTDAQKKKLYSSYVNSGIKNGTNRVSKLEASKLIDMKEQLDAKNKFLKKYKPTDRNHPETKKKKQESLREWIEKEKKAEEKGRENFETFRKRTLTKAEAVKKELKQEQKEKEHIAEKFESGNMELSLTVNIMSDAERKASEKQIAFAKSLYRSMREKNFCFDREDINFEWMMMREISLYIDVMKYILNNLPDSDGQVLVSTKDMNDTVDAVMNTKEEKLSYKIKLTKGNNHN